MSFRRNYAAGNILHATNKHIETQLKDRQQGSDTLLKWFTDNLLKANPEKYHLLVSTSLLAQMKKTFKRRGDRNK